MAWFIDRANPWLNQYPISSWTTFTQIHSRSLYNFSDFFFNLQYLSSPMNSCLKSEITFYWYLFFILPLLTYYNKQKCTSGECGVINWWCIFEKQKSDLKISFFFFFLESFNLWRLFLIIALLSSDQDTNKFLV